MKKIQLQLLVFLILGLLFAAPSFAGGNKLVGSWASTSLVDGGGEAQTLWTFGRGGTVVVSVGMDGFSAAHGAWKRLGGGHYEVINTAFGYAPDGSLAFTITNRASFEVNGDTFIATFTSEVVALDGTVLATTSGTAEGVRIKVGD